MQPHQNKNLVGPEVRRLRVEAGFTQEQLAGRLQVHGWDISRVGVSKIEARLRLVNDAELWVLSRVLACNPADLYPSDLELLPEVLRQGKH